MGTKLRQLSEGRWYKFGIGKPVEATDEEVELWLSAQAEFSEKLGRPKTVWARIIDSAKWATFFVAVVTFLTLYVDWNIVNGQCIELGIEELSFVVFSRHPMHIQGVILLGILLFYLVALVVSTWLMYRVLMRPLLSKSKRLQRVGLVISLAVMFLPLVLLPRSRDISTTPSTVLNIYFPAICVTLIAGLLVRDWAQEYLAVEAKKALFALIAAAGFFLAFFGLFSLYPEAYGMERAREIFRGEANFPAISMIAARELPMSDRVTIQQVSNGRWLYTSNVITEQDMQPISFSLQYLGADEDTIYVLDVGAGHIHAIPKSVVEDLVIHTFGREIWSPAYFDISDYWVTPTSPVETPSPEP